MSRKEKLIERLISLSVDFSWQDLKSLLNGMGYKEIRRGKTGGSRVAFFNEKKDHIIRLHRPHPSNDLSKKGFLNER
jgi:mRNA-degrading endonuclease RelE of RelBE toxin-antitoxin system